MKIEKRVGLAHLFFAVYRPIVAFFGWIINLFGYSLWNIQDCSSLWHKCTQGQLIKCLHVRKSRCALHFVPSCYFTHFQNVFVTLGPNI